MEHPTGHLITVETSIFPYDVNYVGGQDVTGSWNIDYIFAMGPSTLRGGGGADTLIGRWEDDILYGNEGRDFIVGSYGADTLYGGQDDDTLYGGNEGGGDTDGGILYGNRGRDLIFGNGHSDTIFGGQGHDRIDGKAGDDILYGNRGDDLIRGGHGDDVLYGNAGDDTLDGHYALYLREDGDTDTLYGGTGEDTFIVHGFPIAADVVADFEAGETLDLSALFKGPYSGNRDAVFLEETTAGTKVVVDLNGADPGIDPQDAVILLGVRGIVLEQIEFLF